MSSFDPFQSSADERCEIEQQLAEGVVMGVVALFVFGMLHFSPGDPAAIIAGDLATKEDVERIREQLGLNEPLHVQYLVYMRDMLSGDWGTSIATRRPVMDDIFARLPASLELIAARAQERIATLSEATGEEE